MGGSDSKFQNFVKINPDQWEAIGDQNGKPIVRSKFGFGQAQVSTLNLDPKRDLQKELSVYNYRRNQNNALVSSVGVEVNKSHHQTMCGNEKTLKVLTQRIPKRYSQLPQLSFQQSLYALCQSLRGYKECYKQVNAFDVTDNMMGINNSGFIKVWVNQNFADNHPSFEKPFLHKTSSVNNHPFTQSNKDEADMVRNVVDVVQQKCQQGQYPPEFRDRIYRNCRSFDDAYSEIRNFLGQSKIQLPDRISTTTTTQIIQHKAPYEQYGGSQQKYQVGNMMEQKIQPLQTYTRTTNLNSPPPAINRVTNIETNQFKGNDYRFTGIEGYNTARETRNDYIKQPVYTRNDYIKQPVYVRRSPPPPTTSSYNNNLKGTLKATTYTSNQPPGLVSMNAPKTINYGPIQTSQVTPGVTVNKRFY